MKTLVNVSLNASVVAVLFAGCGAPQSSIDGPGALPQTRAIVRHADRGASWMLPETKSDTQLLYVADDQSNDVSVVKLPQGKLVGTLTGFDGPYGECTDSNGDVFIADSQAAQIWEYAHGAKSPRNILADSGYYPIGCSVDPKTGNLAVTNEIGDSGPGNVAVYANASGKPKFYSDSSITQFGFCAYDGSGNLYAGGGTSGDESLFAELPKGQSKFTALTLNADVSGFSPMRWDGQDLAILDGVPGSLIYRFKISGTTGTEVGLLKLRGANEIGDFAIQAGTLYAPLYEKNEVDAYTYPGGGKTLKTFYGFGGASGTAVSMRSGSDSRSSTPNSLSGHQTFKYTGTVQTFTVPKNVTQIRVHARGANGSSEYDDLFGFGARLTAVIPVTGGETLYVFVGGNASGGTGGFNGGADGGTDNCCLGQGGGGGGGGASDVRVGGTSLNDRILVAAGGGGEGGEGGGQRGQGGRGGKGGGLRGGNGGVGKAEYVECNGKGGHGGTQAAGGVGGAGSDCGYTGGGSGANGKLGSGGAGGDGGSKGVGEDAGAGGGGGGGYYGGGGGGGGADSREQFGIGAGGGGGSSYVESSATNVHFYAGGEPRIGGLIVLDWQ